MRVWVERNNEIFLGKNSFQGRSRVRFNVEAAPCDVFKTREDVGILKSESIINIYINLDWAIHQLIQINFDSP